MKKLSRTALGTSLDSRSGVFCWQPGPGFVGDYDVLFVRSDACAGLEKIRVRVTLAPVAVPLVTTEPTIISRLRTIA